MSQTKAELIDPKGDVAFDTNTFYVDATNNRVGVGSNAPSYLLDLLGSAPRIRVKDSSTGAAFHHFENNSGNFYLGIDNSTGGSLSAGNYARLLWSQGAYPLVFATNDTERMRIDSSGRLLVGTTTDPTVGTFASARFSLKQSTDSGIGAGFQIEASGDTSLLWCGYNGTSFDFGTSYRTSGGIKPITFSVGATERMRIDGTGLVTLAGPGIKFPATQVASADANTLDDYEEGTWTPTIRFSGASTGVTYSSRTGYYTKVGNIVTLQAQIALSNKGSSTGAVTIGGSPFSLNRTGNANATNAVRLNNTNSITAPLVCFTYEGINVYQNGGGSVNETHFNNNTSLEFSLIGVID